MNVAGSGCRESIVNTAAIKGFGILGLYPEVDSLTFDFAFSELWRRYLRTSKCQIKIKI